MENSKKVELTFATDIRGDIPFEDTEPTHILFIFKPGFPEKTITKELIIDDKKNQDYWYKKIKKELKLDVDSKNKPNHWSFQKLSNFCDTID